MKKYIVDVLIGFQSVKKYVVETLDIAEMIAENFRDDVTDVVIREVDVL
jgi:hypothetical protein